RRAGGRRLGAPGAARGGVPELQGVPRRPRRRRVRADDGGIARAPAAENRVGAAQVAELNIDRRFLVANCALLAPALAVWFSPTNPARPGVLYPLILSVAQASGARAGETSRRRLGSFLMFSGMASLTVSSALWYTAMAANPLGAEIARSHGVKVDFGSWFVAA